VLNGEGAPAVRADVSEVHLRRVRLFSAGANDRI
jgi:hypothetical protein